MNLDDLFDEPPMKADAPAVIPEISYDDSEIFNNKELYALAKSGKTQMWKAEVLEESTEQGWRVIRATYGFTDGKKQTKDTFVKSGTNIGKKNEKTIDQQAFVKLSQMYEDRIKKNSMVWDIKDWVKPSRPMLSPTWKKRKKHLKHVKAWLIDRKYNGVRSYTYSDGSIQSKSGEPLTPFKHIAEEHKKTFFKGHPKYGKMDIDGEMFIFKMPLEDINSLVSKDKDEDRSTDILLEYHVYNCYFPDYPDMKAQYRYKILQEMFEEYEDELKFIKLSEKQLIENDESVIEEISRGYLTEGFEGGMLLDVDGPYAHSQKSTDRTDYSIKFKFMEDEEFFIVDIIENDQEIGVPKFIIDLRNGNECEVVMSGEKEKAKVYWTDRDLYIKKAWITVQYQDWTKYGRLSFPVGLSIREGSIDEDGNFVPKY